MNENLQLAAAARAAKYVFNRFPKFARRYYGDSVELAVQYALMYVKEAPFDARQSESNQELFAYNYARAAMRNDLFNEFGVSAPRLKTFPTPKPVEKIQAAVYSEEDAFKEMFERIGREENFRIIKNKLAAHDKKFGTALLDKFQKLESVQFNQQAAADKYGGKRNKFTGNNYGASRQSWNHATLEIIAAVRGDSVKKIRKDRQIQEK